MAPIALPRPALEHPGYRVQEQPPGITGIAWLRGAVPRFAEGGRHRRLRARVQVLIAGLDPVPGAGDTPTGALLRTLGLDPRLAADVSAAATSYPAHEPVTDVADTAVDRLVAAIGRYDDATAAVICVLVQADAAMAALLEQERTGSGGPPVPFTRRLDPASRLVLVDLTDAPYGRGVHACPGEQLARTIVGSLR